MAICKLCGNHIIFRYIDGKATPIHVNGSCAALVGRGAESSVRDYTGYKRSEDSCCFKTSCPVCNESVYFIRHNGGSVWIDPPLGPPWYKHPCMDSSAKKGERNLLFENWSKGEKLKDSEKVSVVVVVESEYDKKITIIGVDTGDNEIHYYAVKWNACYLYSKIVIVNEEDNYIFIANEKEIKYKIICKINKLKPKRGYKYIKCPSCEQKFRDYNGLKHYKNNHFFSSLLDIES